MTIVADASIVVPHQTDTEYYRFIYKTIEIPTSVVALNYL